MSDQFGGLPPAPPSSSQDWAQPPRGPRPDTVTNAVRLMYALVAINLISVIVLFSTKDDLRKRIRANTPNASNATVNAAVTVAVVIAVVFIVLYALLAFQVSRGRNWARIVTWVLAGLAIISGLVGLGQPEPTLSRIVGVIALLLEIGIVVLLAVKRSNPYFRR
ncbi:MAG: hypothetical protein ACR2LX_17070 [Jatrophihabitans sp.]